MKRLRFLALLLLLGVPAWGQPLPPCAAHLPRAGHRTSTDPALKERVERIVRETLERHSPISSFWGSHNIALGCELFNNPPVKYLQIRTGCGNSYLGALPPVLVLRPTRDLFAAYGIPLRAKVPLVCGGQRLVADGYNQELRVGFKIIWPSGVTECGGSIRYPVEPAHSRLTEDKLEVIDEQIAAGRVNLFVADASRFQITDVAGVRAPLAFYLTSLVDYLNWLHGAEFGDRQAIRGAPASSGD